MSDAALFADLLHRYLVVCNQALDRQKTGGPMRAVLDAAFARLEGEGVSVALYDDRPKLLCTLGVDRAQPRLRPGHVTPLDDQPLDGRVTDRNGPRVVRLSVSMVQAIVDDPETYLSNPSLIDWSWLCGIERCVQGTEHQPGDPS